MVLDGKSSQEYPVNAGVSESSILGPTLFGLYINDLPDNVICDIAIYADYTSLYSKHLNCGNNLNWLLNLNLIYKTLWSKKWLVDFIAGEAQLVSFGWSNNNGSIDVEMDGSFREEKSSFKILD